MELSGKNILVMGLARTGVACCRFLAGRGALVVATDMRDAAALAAVLAELDGMGIRFVLGRHDAADFLAADLIVVSPGVPMDSPLLVSARGAGKEIVTEIELAARFINAPMVAITGTNGKTTTTTLCGEIFRVNGFETYVGGNIGDPLIELVESGREAQRVVVEISSFQMEWICSFRPKIAALLNISEDHLDRYGSYQEYIDAKLRMFENQTADDFAVLNADDPLVWSYAGKLKARIFPFSRKQEFSEGIFCTADEIVYRHDGNEACFPYRDFRLKGVHNLENILAALACALLGGCRPDTSFKLVRDFEALHHRMEFVRTVSGVDYYEDSKATNVGSVVKALESFDRITLIAGGKDKGGSYGPLVPLIRERVSHLILIGEAADRMAAELGTLTDTRRATTMEAAVQLAASITAPGGTVLMSPACSSFDMFRDYEERAKRFIEAVKGL